MLLGPPRSRPPDPPRDPPPPIRVLGTHPLPDPSTLGRRYDITEFVANHPGGNRILLGAGKSIDAYWNLYQQHLNSAAPMELLQSMQIGAALLSF